MQHLILPILIVMVTWIFFQVQKTDQFISSRTSAAGASRYSVWVASLHFLNTWIFVPVLRWQTLMVMACLISWQAGIGKERSGENSQGCLVNYTKMWEHAQYQNLKQGMHLAALPIPKNSRSPMR